jgi:hypothetical protein
MPEAALPISSMMLKPMPVLVEYPERQTLQLFEIMESIILRL